MTKSIHAKSICLNQNRFDMKYKKINNLDQYNKYCDIHEKLTYKDEKSNKEEIELIEILIDEYESRTIEFEPSLNPIELIEYLIKENQISKSQLARELKVSRQLVTDVLNYRRDISKAMILKLSKRFNINTSAFTREYKLIRNPTTVKKQIA